ncbi:hypothetical protein Q3G72_000745 [Acer saccharum]|nr:hypothetical protein Q3G72_000745 [Acer saccharum]
MATLTDLKLVSILVFTIFHFESTLQTPSSSAAETYIIHMDISAMPKAFSGHHSWYMSMLSSSSKHIYTYTDSIHGFSAILTSSELESLKNSPGYVSSTRDHPLKVHTTNTPQFLGLSSSSGAWPASNYGEGVIIGVVDTGIWPETTTDREFEGILTLGNQVQISFASLYPGNSSSRQIPLVYMDRCESVTELKKVKFNIIVCKDDLSISNQIENAVSAEVVGAVFISNSSISESEFYIRSSFPAAFTGLRDGQTIIDYTHKSSNPTASLQFQKTVIGTKPAPKLDSYSSRGPFPSCPSILKPDLLAPGSLVLASWSPISPVAKVRPSRLLFSDFNLLSGTSMATPHVAGVAAIMKAVHPEWSPAAIRSALVTTADSLDNTLGPIKDIANYDLPASPLEMGAGLINPNKALNPGLVYDATADDYVKFLCAMNYTTTQIRIITKSSRNCINRFTDLNYPSFIAFFNNVDSNPNEKAVQVFWRTVTNVGDQGGTSYTANLKGMEGLKVYVEPHRLEFKQKYEKQSYKLTLEGPKWLEKAVIFGSLTWVNDNGKYVVRSPIVATNLVPESP